jgi:hypothetical protein
MANMKVRIPSSKNFMCIMIYSILFKIGKLEFQLSNQDIRLSFKYCNCSI